MLVDIFLVAGLLLTKLVEVVKWGGGWGQGRKSMGDKVQQNIFHPFQNLPHKSLRFLKVLKRMFEGSGIYLYLSLIPILSISIPNSTIHGYFSNEISFHCIVVLGYIYLISLCIIMKDIKIKRQYAHNFYSLYLDYFWIILDIFGLRAVKYTTAELRGVQR